jgi:hypothetical protein
MGMQLEHTQQRLKGHGSFRMFLRRGFHSHSTLSVQFQGSMLPQHDANVCASVLSGTTYAVADASHTSAQMPQSTL